jgi:hypothetical protein
VKIFNFIFSVKLSVILKYLSKAAFCHKGKFVFSKSTLNSVFWCITWLCYEQKICLTFIRYLTKRSWPFLKATVISKVCFGRFWYFYKQIFHGSTLVQNNFFIKNRHTLLNTLYYKSRSRAFNYVVKTIFITLFERQLEQF